MLSFYQHLPEHINPIAFSAGFFSVRWYSLMYLFGLAVAYFLLRCRAYRDKRTHLISNFEFLISNQIQNLNDSNFKHSKLVQNSNFKIQNLVLDWMLYSIVGLLIGARLGYVLFYNFNYFFRNPLSIVSPYDFSAHSWTGIFGMSYFGGALGVIAASCIFAKKRNINFWAWANWVIPAVPAGYFFGRIGNFLNGELYGRVTAKPWGMYFPGAGANLRHPSQLYEAIWEGLAIFLILWYWRNKEKFSAQMTAIYFFLYGLFRFIIEFFRSPDSGARLFFGFLTLGQIFSLGFVILSILIYGVLSKRKKAL